MPAAVALLMAAACSSGGATSPATASTPVGETSTSAPQPTSTSIDELDAQPLGQAGCQPASPMVTDDIPEVRGTAGDQHLHGLLFVTQRPIAVGDTVKIVWRMTGTGDLTATATAPDGSQQPLEWGPEGHTGSSYLRPGDEWGAGYRFTQPGCWRLHLVRADAQGDVWLDVASLASSNLSQTSTDLDCATAIDAVAAPPSGYAAQVDAVALPTLSLQANPSGDSSSDRRLFAKTGLLVRSGATADLVIPLSDQSVATMGWGSTGTPAKVVHVAGCTSSDPSKPWLAYAGGFYVPNPACISLVVAAGARQVAVPIGMGAACAGQDPPPEPAG